MAEWRPKDELEKLKKEKRKNNIILGVYFLTMALCLILTIWLKSL